MLLHLDKWQREVLEYTGNLVLCTGRQVGKTTIMAIKAVEWMAAHPGHKIIIVSLTEDQAKLIIVMILNYAEKKYPHLLARGKDKPTQNKVILKNKSSALARPVGNTGDAIRGFTGDILIIDEASRMPERVWTAGRPTLLTTAGKIWMCSTPFGKKGYFWEAFQNKAGKYRVFHISSEKVISKREISGSWSAEKRKEALKFLEDEKKTMTSLEYGQEYLGLFLEDLRQFFPDELIDKICCRKRPAVISGECYLGADIAGMGEDLTSFEILQKKGIIIQVENITKKGLLTTQSSQIIKELNRQYALKGIGIDDMGIGFGVFSELITFPETKKITKALNNSQRFLDHEERRHRKLMKEEMYSNLLMLMEQAKIYLLDDEDIKASLRSVQYELHKKDEGSETQLRIFGRDTHIAEGIVRAAWMANESKTLNLWIYSRKDGVTNIKDGKI